MNVQTIILSGYTARTERSGSLILGTAGSYGNEQLAILRKPDWEGLNIRVVFNPCGVELLVPEDGILSVPWEATAQTLSYGQGCITFQGAEEGRVIYTADLPYLVQAHTPSEGVPPQEHTPALSEELLKRVYEIGTAAENSAKSAQSAEASAALASDSAQTARNAQSAAENSAETAEAYARAAASSAEEAQKAAGISLDTTLTEDGKAADAKAAGDAVRTLKQDVDDCVRNIIAETDSFEESVPSENPGLIEDAENVLIVHGNGETVERPLLSDSENLFPFPYQFKVTSSNGVTFSSYYRCITINADGTGSGVVTSYLKNGAFLPISDFALETGDSFSILVKTNKLSPDCSSRTVRILFYDSTPKFLKNFTVSIGKNDTLTKTGSCTVPEGAASFRICLEVSSNAVWDDVKVYPILLKADAALTELASEALADGESVRIPYSEIRDFALVNTFDYKHSYQYKIDAKTYIDNHISEVKMTYTTPEDFGAVGDGEADDTEAVKQCMEYGFEQNLPIKMNQTYLLTSPLKIKSGTDVFIKILKYVGTDAAIIVDCTKSRVDVRSLTSNGVGISLRGETADVIENELTVGFADCKSHCILLESPAKAVSGNRITFMQLKAGGDGCFCIARNLQEEISYITENSFFGGHCTNADWAYYGGGGNNKFYNIQVEGKIKGGFCFIDRADAMIIGDRHAESARDGEYPYIKIKSTETPHSSYSAVFTALHYISTIGLPVNEIDVSEASPEMVNDDGYVTSAVAFGTLGLIDCRITSWQRYGENQTNKYQYFGERCLIWANALIFQGVPYKYYTVTESLDLRTITEDTPAMPSVFEIACENCEIHLHPTYCFMGIKKFEVIQTETYQAKIYDYFTGSLIFDGTQYGAGTFEISNYLNGNCARIDGTNMIWSIKQIE